MKEVLVLGAVLLFVFSLFVLYYSLAQRQRASAKHPAQPQQHPESDESTND